MPPGDATYNHKLQTLKCLSPVYPSFENGLPMRVEEGKMQSRFFVPSAWYDGPGDEQVPCKKALAPSHSPHSKGNRARAAQRRVSPRILMMPSSWRLAPSQPGSQMGGIMHYVVCTDASRG